MGGSESRFEYWRVTTVRIVHSLHGKFHHQDWTRQIDRLCVFHMFFAGYLRFKLKNLNVPWNRVNAFPWLEVPYHAGLRYLIRHDPQPVVA